MTGNPLIDKILVGFNSLLILAAVGLFVFSTTMIKRPQVDENAKFSSMADQAYAESQKELIKLPEQIINLHSRESRLRFLSVVLSLEPFESGQTEILQQAKPVIIDRLIDIVSQMKPDEINSVTGRMTVETRLKNQVNAHMGGALLKKIYFSKFIVQ